MSRNLHRTLALAAVVAIAAVAVGTSVAAPTPTTDSYSMSAASFPSSATRPMQPATARRAGASRFRLAKPTMVSKISVHIAVRGLRKPRTIRVGLYADNGGKPAILVGTTKPYPVSSDRSARWVTLSLAARAALARGRYYASLSGSTTRASAEGVFLGGVRVHAAGLGDVIQLPKLTPTGYPNASNTGVRDPSLLTPHPSEVYEVTTRGLVIENKVFSRAVIVSADNVTFRNCRWKFASDFYQLRVENGYGGVLVEDSEFDGMGSSTLNAMVAGSGWTLRRVDMQGAEDAAKLGNSTHIYDSYIHNMWGGDPKDPHYDGFQSMGGSNNVIQHNTIDVGVGKGRNAAVFLKTDFGPISNVTVDNNRLLGGGWAFASVDAEKGFGAPKKVKLTNNRFGPSAYGPINNDSPDLVRSGNVWDSTGEPIPGG